MQMTGTDKQISYATDIIDGIRAADLGEYGRDQQKMVNAAQSALEILDAMSQPGATIETCRPVMTQHQSDPKKAEDIAYLIYKYAVPKNPRDLIGLPINAGTLIATFSTVFHYRKISA